MRELSKSYDDYTWAHVFAGMVLACLNVKPGLMLALAIGFEVIEEPIKQETRIFGKEPMIETEENQLIDVGAVIAGYGAIEILRKPAGVTV